MNVVSIICMLDIEGLLSLGSRLNPELLLSLIPTAINCMFIFYWYISSEEMQDVSEETTLAKNLKSDKNPCFHLTSLLPVQSNVLLSYIAFVVKFGPRVENPPHSLGFTNARSGRMDSFGTALLWGSWIRVPPSLSLSGISLSSDPLPTCHKRSVTKGRGAVVSELSKEERQERERERERGVRRWKRRVEKEREDVSRETSPGCELRAASLSSSSLRQGVNTGTGLLIGMSNV